MNKMIALTLILSALFGVTLKANPYDGRGYIVTDASQLILPSVNPGVQTVWADSVVRARGDYIREYLSNGSYDYYWCITAGPSAAVKPTFSSAGDVTDGAAVWRYVNPVRGYYTIQNDGAAAVYLSFGSQIAVVSQGTRLNAAGGSLLRNQSPYLGEVRAVSTTGLSNIVLVQELPK
tara:strand:- start:10438 stop:10968 length:531 start_codon:yes stop_codon:yes gene_type:complete